MTGGELADHDRHGVEILKRRAPKLLRSTATVRRLNIQIEVVWRFRPSCGDEELAVRQCGNARVHIVVDTSILKRVRTAEVIRSLNSPFEYAQPLFVGQT